MRQRFAPIGLLLATTLALTSLPARADIDSAMDQALGNINIEKVLGQILGSIDFNALFASIQRTATDAASGKTPDATPSAATQEMQTVAPQLIKGVTSAIGPLMNEMKAEIQRELVGGLAGSSSNTSNATMPNVGPNQ